MQQCERDWRKSIYEAHRKCILEEPAIAASRPIASSDLGLHSDKMRTRLLACFLFGGREFRKTESPSMWKACVPVAFLLVFSVQAQAHPHHSHHHRYYQSMALFDGDAQTAERVVGSRPIGCPHAFCGCEAALFRFGRIIPQLNLAANWRRFPRSAPAPGMAAVRSGHVLILQQHVAGDVWYVHDGNSGGHVTREHPRSIAGYTIVDPSALHS
jgi:hypothetical protein